MKFLEEQGLIDLKTGAGWFDSEFRYTSYSLEYNTIQSQILDNRKNKRS